MSNDSPFSMDRFEYDRKHLYFLPKEIFNKLEDLKPTYLIGSRGTGKTTLLHALSWSERLRNNSLLHALNRNKGLYNTTSNEPLKKRECLKDCIGVYLKLPKFALTRIEEWLKPKEEYFQQTILSIYIDLIWLELLSEALADLTLYKLILSDPKDEHDLVERVFNDIPEFKNHISNPNLLTLKFFTKTITSVRKSMERHALYGDDHEVLRNKVPSGNLGELGRTVSSLMVEYCNKYDQNCSNRWHFKICMDEAECLSPLQLLVINSLIRLSQYPTYFIIAFVRKPENLTATLIPNLSQQKADRNLIYLDNIKDEEFDALADGVATVRIIKKLKDPSISFNTEDILGKLNIDFLIFKTLSNSTNTEATNFLNKASSEDLSRILPNESEPISREHDNNVPPLYKAYLIDRLNLKPQTSLDYKTRRKIDSSDLRKKMIVAYLSICKEFKVEVRYAFARMVFQMSDKCIRDYLSQMNEIFIECNLSLSDFIKQKDVDYLKQDKALKRASEQKKEGLPKSGIKSPKEVGRLVDGLAILTKMGQTGEGASDSLLTSTEKGRFVLDLSNLKDEDKTILSLVFQAAEAGYIRIISNEESDELKAESVLKFQVHCSLAAYYGFSYRGAYYETPILFADIRNIINSEPLEKHQKSIQQLATRLFDLPDINQMKLGFDRETK